MAFLPTLTRVQLSSYESWTEVAFENPAAGKVTLLACRWSS